MIATASRRSHASAGRLLFFFLAAVLALTGLGGKASAATWSTTQTRVGASDPAPTTPVGAGGHITAGQRPGEVLPQPGVAQGHGVHTYYVIPRSADGATTVSGVLVHNCDITPPLSIGSKQFGSKWGRHAKDYGLDASSSSSRTWFKDRARAVHRNPSEVRRGPWNPEQGGGSNYYFFRQGDDLVVTKPGGEFVTMFPGARSNGWFQRAKAVPH